MSKKWAQMAFFFLLWKVPDSWFNLLKRMILLLLFRSPPWCPWHARCSKPGSIPWGSCPTLQTRCLTNPRAAFPTSSRSCRSIPGTWRMVLMFCPARCANQKSFTACFAQKLQSCSLTITSSAPFLAQMGPAAQILSTLPYRGGSDLGQDKMSKLINFNFLLSCLRRDSHKIDSFLKVLRCRAANMQPNLC